MKSRGVSFSFTSLTWDEILKEIQRINIKKTTQEGDAPTKIIQQYSSLIVHLFKGNINYYLKAVVHADQRKKDCKTEKSN